MILRVVAGGAHMKELTRITTDPQVMGGKPCIRGLRVTVGTIVGLVAAGRSKEEILKLHTSKNPTSLRLSPTRRGMLKRSRFPLGRA